MLPNIAYKKLFPNISTSSFVFYPKLLTVLNINDDICTKFILRLKSRLIWIFQKKNYSGSKVLSPSMNLKMTHLDYASIIPKLNYQKSCVNESN